MRLFIFGDSITQGYFGGSSAWVNQLANYYQQEALRDLNSDWIDTFNLGVSGDTAEGILKRIEPEIKARQLGEEAQECIVIAVGINDSILRDNIVETEVYDFQTTYEKLIDKALEICPRVICLGLTAVNEEETDPWEYSSSGKQWKNNRINLFEDTIKQVAITKEVVFVPLHDQFLDQLNKSDMLSDGLHPNEIGHRFIYDKVKEVIDTLIKL